MKRSNCCGAPLIAETDLCSQCKEHAGYYEDVSWACPQCTGSRLEEVMSGVTVASTVNSMSIEDGEISIEYGEQSNEDGEIECYQCMDCGYRVASSQEELIEVLS